MAITVPQANLFRREQRGRCWSVIVLSNGAIGDRNRRRKMNAEVLKDRELGDVELTEKELNKVTGGTTGHNNQDYAGRHDPLDRNRV